MAEERKNFHISVEGPIGVGKTSLTILLSWEMNLKAFFEPVDYNPYLADFYSDMQRFAFPAQLYFLVQRFRKQLRLQNLKRTRSVISDFYFLKDQIFAQMNLSEKDKELYDRIIGEMLPFTEEPDLIIYLDAPLPVLMERIHRRSRQAERLISEDYEDKVAENYKNFFRGFQHAPLLPVDTTFLDFVNRENDKKVILQIIRGALK